MSNTAENNEQLMTIYSKDAMQILEVIRSFPRFALNIRNIFKVQNNEIFIPRAKEGQIWQVKYKTKAPKIVLMKEESVIPEEEEKPKRTFYVACTNDVQYQGVIILGSEYAEFAPTEVYYNLIGLFGKDNLFEFDDVHNRLNTINWKPFRVTNPPTEQEIADALYPNLPQEERLEALKREDTSILSSSCRVAPRLEYG